MYGVVLPRSAARNAVHCPLRVLSVAVRLVSLNSATQCTTGRRSHGDVVHFRLRCAIQTACDDCRLKDEGTTPRCPRILVRRRRRFAFAARANAARRSPSTPATETYLRAVCTCATRCHDSTPPLQRHDRASSSSRSSHRTGFSLR